MSTYLLDRIEHDAHITVYPGTVVAAVNGDRQLDTVVIEDRLTGEHTDVRTRMSRTRTSTLRRLSPMTAWTPTRSPMR